MGQAELLGQLRIQIERATAELHNAAAQLHDLSLQLKRTDDDEAGVREDADFIDHAQQRIEYASRCLLDHVDALAEEVSSTAADQNGG
jgi:hypothetical protein